MARIRIEPSITVGNCLQIGVLVLSVLGFVLSKEHWVGAADTAIIDGQKKFDKIDTAVKSLSDTSATLTANQTVMAETLRLLREDQRELRAEFMKDLESRVVRKPQ